VSPGPGGQLYRYERHHLKAEEPLVEGGADCPDDAAGEQGADPAQTGRKGQADATGQFVDPDTPILLKLGQYLQVDVVERRMFCHGCRVRVPGSA
jgi:hypothetical protein